MDGGWATINVPLIMSPIQFHLRPCEVTVINIKEKIGSLKANFKLTYSKTFSTVSQFIMVDFS